MPTFPRLRPTAGTLACAALIAIGVLAPAALGAGTGDTASPSPAKPAPVAGAAAPAGHVSMARGALRGTTRAYVVFSRRTMSRTFARSVRTWMRANRRVRFVAVGYRLTRKQAGAAARAGRWRMPVIADPRGRVTGRMKVRTVPALLTVDRRGKVREVRFATARRQRVPARLRTSGRRVLPPVPKARTKPRTRRAPAAPVAPAAPAPAAVPAPPPSYGRLIYRLGYGSRTLSVDGRATIRATYEAGSSGGGAGLGVWGYFAPVKTARLRYAVKFDPNFNWGGSVQKLPGLGGGSSPTGGQSSGSGWSARIQVEGKGASATVTGYLYVSAMPAGAEGTSGGAVVRGADVRVRPGWNEIDYYVSVNNPGRSDGVIAITVNGQLAVHHAAVRFNDSPPGAGEILGESFFGGLGTSPQTQSAYFTEMEVYDG